ncbi:hypothetical protein EPO05_06070 [Patescibacteria group bacterium]|nr:MAG: hypothetical protein EPO05_06070 [Patescibacteria group bacterium]
MKHHVLTLIGWLAVAAGSGCPAYAFSNAIHVASAEIPQSVGLCSGCQIITEFPAPGAPITVMQIPSDGSLNFSVLVWMRMPEDVTDPSIKFSITRMTPDAVNSGRVCDKVCVGAIRDGESVANLDVSSCMLPSDDVVQPQWVNMTRSFDPLSIIPRDASSIPCTAIPADPHDCRGAWLAIQIVRINTGDCSSPSVNLIEYEFVSPTFAF